MSLSNVSFINTVPALPASAPADNAHVINEGVTGNSTARIQDAIATLLYKISSDTLTTFLKPDIKNFRLIQRLRTGEDEMIIMKRVGKVIIGIATEFPKQDTLEFDNLVRLDVETDGSWKVTYTSYRDYFRYSWDDVWAGATVDREFSTTNLKAYAGNSTTPEDDERLSLFPEQLTKMILNDRMWNPVEFASTLVTE